MTTSVIQQKGFPKTNPPYKKGEIPLYHRSGEKPLDPTTLVLKDTEIQSARLLVEASILIGGSAFRKHLWDSKLP